MTTSSQRTFGCFPTPQIDTTKQNDQVRSNLCSIRSFDFACYHHPPDPVATMDPVQEWVSSMQGSTNDQHHTQAINGLDSLVSNQTSPTETAQMITNAYQGFLEADPSPTTTEDSKRNKVSTFWALYMCHAIWTSGSATERERLVNLLVQISR